MQNNHSGQQPSLKQQGLALLQGNRLAEAKAVFKQACEANAQDADAWHLLSSIHGMLGELDEAGDCCRRAIALQPNHGQAHLNLGNVLYLQGDLDAAVKEYQNVLQIDPNDSAVHNNLGNLLYNLGNIDEAMIHFQESIRLNPNNAETHSNLGNIFFYYKGRPNDALNCYREALRLNPGLVQAHINQGNVYTLQGRLDEALTSYKEALRYEPRNALAHSNLLFMLSYRSDYDVATLFAEHVRWGEIHGRDPSTLPPHTNIPDEGKRLRIGYVSADFRNHPVGIFIEQVLAHHDKSRFEIYCYSNHGLKDDLTERLRRHADHWRDVLALPDEALAQQIRRDGIDILVDLAGHTAGNRLLTFALKPAPVQVTWMSYIATTGLKAIDYIIGNRYIIPPQEEAYYVERVVRLPHSFLCFTPPRAPIEVGPPPAQSSEWITFGCFNNTAKLTPEVITTWSKILQAVPRSRLFLKSGGFNDEDIREHFQKLFAKHQIRDERLIFAGRSPRNEYLAAYNEVDIGLDPFPYNGGTTTVEALWMGVPVITLSGDRFVSHMGESIMMNLGMEECVTHSEQAYIAKAIALASDLPRLAALRSGLRHQLLNSPLCDGSGFTRDLETAYRHMWEAWCQAQTESA
jgi:predicted O-linked N-acetylglucosamine transferase (SPINDLY family)